MRKAIITYTRTNIWSEVETNTRVIEEEDILTFYARIAGSVDGLVGDSNIMGNSIVGIEVSEV